MDIALIVIIAAIAVAVLTIYALRQTKAANSATLQAEALKERTTELAQQLAQCNAQLDSANRQTLKLTSVNAKAWQQRCIVHIMVESRSLGRGEHLAEE